MNLLSYQNARGPQFGIAKSDGLAINLTHATGCTDMAQALKRHGPQALLEMAEKALSTAEAQDGEVVEKYRPVVADANRIFCVGLNYEEHRSETGRPATIKPTIFLRLASSQIGHGDAIVVPKEVPEGLDYEGEIAIVIGKSGRRIEPENAWDYVFGYAPYNDASARSWQSHSTQWTAGKNFPATGAFGPVLVTAETLGKAPTLELTTRLNGQVLQQADTSMLIFPIPELISYISTFTELEPGDVIVTGTPGGVGFKRTPPILMQPGDVVEIEIKGMPILRNPVIGETP